MKRYERQYSRYNLLRGHPFLHASLFYLATILSVLTLSLASCSLENVNLSSLLSGSPISGSPDSGSQALSPLSDLSPGSQLPEEEKVAESQRESLTKSNSDLNGKQLVGDKASNWLKGECSKYITAKSTQDTEYIGFFRVADKKKGDILIVSKGGTIQLKGFSRGTGDSFNPMFGVEATAAAFNEPSAFLALAYPNSVKIFSLTDCSKPYELKSLKTRIASMAFQPDGTSLVLGAVDGKIYRWRFIDEMKASKRLDRDRTLERYFGHATVVSQVMFHPIGRIFFSGDWDGKMSAWLPYDADRFGGQYDRNVSDLRYFSEQSIRQRADRGAGENIDRMVISIDGELLALATQDGTIELWRVRGLKKIGGVKAHKGLIYDLTISDNGAEIVSVGRDGRLLVWKLNVPAESVINTPDHETFELIREKPGSDLRRVVFLSKESFGGASAEGKIVKLKTEMIPFAIKPTPTPQVSQELF